MRCAVSDFDRTLYVEDRISGTDRRAVEEWQGRGNLFVVATGRDEAALKEKLAAWKVFPDALILNNGALILDGHGRELFCRAMERETALGVLDYFAQADEAGTGVSIRGRKLNVLPRPGAPTTQKPCGGEILMEDARCLQGILQLHHRRPDSPEAIREMCRDINRLFPMARAYANVWNADVVAKGIHKAGAIRILEQKLGPFKEIRVIGDSINDLDMIRAYHGTALPWAAPEVLAAAAGVAGSVGEWLRAAPGCKM